MAFALEQVIELGSVNPAYFVSMVIAGLVLWVCLFFILDKGVKWVDPHANTVINSSED